MSGRIEPRTLKGFRDYLPEMMIPRERLLEAARGVYRRYGFAPIDTPALEYAEILLGKGGEESDKIVYRFQDHGNRDVALRFDLTVPFARFAAMHVGKLGIPFKRYAMGPVWRGENTGHGRYREFWQCDFDTIGTTSVSSDAEALLVAHDLMVAAGIERFVLRVNHRQVLGGLLETMGLGDQATAMLRAIDKLPKVGADAVAAEMMEKAGATRPQADTVLALAGRKGEPLAILSDLAVELAGSERGMAGVTRLREVFEAVLAAGLPPERIGLDLAIARGLDYYTGIIFETFLGDLPGIGSVCSGGRYDDLAGLYTKQALPGVGASLGVDRLLAALEELKCLGMAGAVAPVLIAQFEAGHLGTCLGLARRLHAAGVGAEVFPEAKKIGQQLQHAEKKGFRVVVLAGPDERARGIWKIKRLADRLEMEQADADVPSGVVELLAGG
jgi:histidyl-tRNA synthetase